MALYRIDDGTLTPVEESRFGDADMLERRDLQPLVRDAIDSIAPGCMVIAEEFGDWEDSKRRLDLLCLDEDANLVVVELKRTCDGGHMELQALRYGAMVAQMTFDRAVAAHEHYLHTVGQQCDARRRLLDFLGWSEEDEDAFAREVRFVLVSAGFSTEITTTVLWLNDHGLDIRCVRTVPHRLEDRVLLSIEQVIPLPEARAYQVRVREKSAKVREERAETRSPTGFHFVNIGDKKTPSRQWDLCMKYGFVSAGGGAVFVRQIKTLQPGDPFLAYSSGHGYVGVGVVVESAVRRAEFVPDGETSSLSEILTSRHGIPVLERDTTAPDGTAERCVRVRWLARSRLEDAIQGQSQRSTVCRIHTRSVVTSLLDAFGVDYEDAEEGSKRLSLTSTPE